MGWTRRGAMAGGLAALSPFASAQDAPDRSDKIIIAKSGHILAPVTMSGNVCYALLDNTQYTALSVDAPVLTTARKRDLERAGRKDDMYLRLRSPVMQMVGNADIQVDMAVRGLSTYTKANGVPVEMIMGANVFESAVVDLDFLAGTIRFTRPSKFTDPEKALVFEAGLKTPGRFEIPVSIGEVKGQALVSLGYGGVIRVHDPKVGEWINDGRATSNTSATTVFGSVSTKEEVVVFESPPVKFGPFDLGKVRAVADVSSHDGAIATVGVTVLRAFRVWLDGSRNRIWLRPNTH